MSICLHTKLYNVVSEGIENMIYWQNCFSFISLNDGYVFMTSFPTSLNPSLFLLLLCCSHIN